MRLSQMHSTLTKTEHKENKMEAITPTENQPTAAEVSRFMEAEKIREAEAKVKADEEAILTETNTPLAECLGECRVEQGKESFDKMKADTAYTLFNINEKFETEMKRLNDDLSISDEVRKEQKSAVIEASEKEFNKVIENTLLTIQEKGKQAEKELFSNNAALSNLDISIMNNPKFLEQLMNRPFDAMNVKHGEANAQIILSLANRGFLSETFTTGKGSVFEGANRRFSPKAHKQYEAVKHNLDSLENISTKQNTKYSRLNPINKSILEKVLG